MASPSSSYDVRIAEVLHGSRLAEGLHGSRFQHPQQYNAPRAQKTETAAVNKHLLSRRQFSAHCAAFGLSFPALTATLALQRTAPAIAAAGPTSEAARRTVRLPDGTNVPALGQGAWHLGQDRH